VKHGVIGCGFGLFLATKQVRFGGLMGEGVTVVFVTATPVPVFPASYHLDYDIQLSWRLVLSLFAVVPLPKP